MSIDLGNNPVGTPPTDEQKTQLRSSMGLGSADIVEFGEVTTSQFNFPNLTTSELDAVTDATEGDTYFDSDRGQFVRFTGSSSYDVISSISSVSEDSLTTSSGVSLPDSKLFESGLVAASADVFSPTATLTIFQNEEFNDSSSTTYLYHSGEQGPAGWYDANDVNAGLVTSSVVVPNRTHLIKQGSASYSFQFKHIVTSSTSPNELVSIPLLGGSEYKIELDVFVGDLAEGNLKFNVGYTGLYNASTIQFKCDDLKNKNQVLFLKGKLSENDSISLVSSGQVAVTSPLLGSYSITLIVKPSSSGTFNMSASQIVSSADPLLISIAETTVTKLV